MSGPLVSAVERLISKQKMSLNAITGIQTAVRPSFYRMLNDRAISQLNMFKGDPSEDRERRLRRADSPTGGIPHRCKRIAMKRRGAM